MTPDQTTQTLDLIANRSQGVEFAVIGFFFLFMVATGLLSRRLVSNFSDYFRSGCKATWWLVGISSFMSSFSAWTFTGAASVAYDAGVTVSVIFYSAAIGLASSAFLTAAWFRQLRAITFPEVINQRFNTPTQQFYLWAGIVPAIMYSALSLLGVAVFASAVFGYEVWVTVVALGIVVIVYSTLGGSWSVLTTDFIQALLLMPIAVLVTFLCLKSIGGVGGLYDSLQQQGLQEHLHVFSSDPASKYSVAWGVAMLAFQIFTWNSLSSSQRVFMCKDGRDARRSVYLTAAMFLIGAFVWFIPPMVARLQFSADVEAFAGQLNNPADASYAVIAIRLLPNGFSGLIVVAMFSATMSSIVFTLNQVAGTFTQDFYQRFVNRSASDRRVLAIGQVASLTVGVGITAIAVLLSFNKEHGMFDLMLQVGSLLATPLSVPMVMALFARRTPVWSAIFSALAGGIVSYVAWASEWSYAQTVFSIIGAGASAYLATIPFWNGTDEAYKKKVAAFYEKMHRPVDFAKEVGGDIDTRQMRMMGWSAFSIGGFIGLLVILPNPLGGRLQILALSGAISGFGVVMLAIAYCTDKRNAAKDAVEASQAS